MLLTVQGKLSSAHASSSSTCMLQVTHAPLQQSTRDDLHTDTISCESSNETDSSRDGKENGTTAAGSTGRKEEEDMSASSSGRGASDEVAELKRQLAASQDNLRNERLHVVACELPALLILNPVIKQFRAKRILVITPGNDLLMLPGTNLS